MTLWRPIHAACCLVNLRILSGQFLLDCSGAAHSSWLCCGEQAEAECSAEPRRCTLLGPRVQDLISAWSACPRVPATHLAALHLSSLPFCKHTRLTF